MRAEAGGLQHCFQEQTEILAMDDQNMTGTRKQSRNANFEVHMREIRVSRVPVLVPPGPPQLTQVWPKHGHKQRLSKPYQFLACIPHVLLFMETQKSSFTPLQS